MDAKMNMKMYRAQVIYSGKYAERSGSIFVEAITEEAAIKYANDLLKNELKQRGVSLDCYKLKVMKSSPDEVDFYKSNIYNKNYTGLMN